MNADVRLLREHGRMCNYFGTCDGCPLGEYTKNQGRLYDCHLTAYVEPEKTAEIIEKWSMENPESHRKTFLDDFKEKYPKYRSVGAEWPCVCVKQLYDVNIRCEDKYCCDECWNSPMPEPPKEE